MFFARGMIQEGEECRDKNQVELKMKSGELDGTCHSTDLETEVQLEEKNEDQ